MSGMRGSESIFSTERSILSSSLTLWGYSARGGRESQREQETDEDALHFLIELNYSQPLNLTDFLSKATFDITCLASLETATKSFASGPM